MTLLRRAVSLKILRFENYADEKTYRNAEEQQKEAGKANEYKQLIEFDFKSELNETTFEKLKNYTDKDEEEDATKLANDLTTGLTKEPSTGIANGLTKKLTTKFT